MKASLRLAIAAIGLVIFNVSSVVVQAQFSYIVTNGTVTITGYTGPGGAVTIPITINGLPVAGIGASAFDSCFSLTSVMIPDSVTSIESGAFSLCPNLSAITVDPLHASYSSMDGILFNKSQSSLIQDPEGKGGSYTIPSSVTCIGDRAFAICVYLTSVVIPNSVTNIGAYAFAFCSRLPSIGIPGSITSIGDYAFYECSGLVSVTIPGSVVSIGADAFANCTNLTSTTVDAGDHGYGRAAGDGCS